MILVIPFQKCDKIESISSIKGTMLEVFKWLEVFWSMVQNELMRITVHHTKKFPALPDYSSSLTPCENRREQTSDLNVLLFSEGMRNRYRIILYKTRLVVEIRLFVKKLLELS